jgi:gamma-glutamyl-gamma-aminobutyrate hydrolase PuuD
MTPKVLVVGDHSDCGSSYYKPFAHIGLKVANIEEMDKGDVCLVVFTGGEDVSPEMYGEEKHPRTSYNKSRDQREKLFFDKAVKLKIPIAGICRGAQFICANSGGKLVQHITGHHGSHDIITDEGKYIRVSSTHHQMQLPPKSALPVAWADPRLSEVYEGAPGKLLYPEVEYDVVYYPETNALGMQYHPEMMSPTSDGFKYCKDLVKRFFGLEGVDSEV